MKNEIAIKIKSINLEECWLPVFFFPLNFSQVQVLPLFAKFPDIMTFPNNMKASYSVSTLSS